MRLRTANTRRKRLQDREVWYRKPQRARIAITLARRYAGAVLTVTNMTKLARQALDAERVNMPSCPDLIIMDESHRLNFIDFKTADSQ